MLRFAKIIWLSKKKQRQILKGFGKNEREDLNL